jgi:hypothetical protein
MIAVNKRGNIEEEMSDDVKNIFAGLVVNGLVEKKVLSFNVEKIKNLNPKFFCEIETQMNLHELGKTPEFLSGTKLQRFYSAVTSFVLGEISIKQCLQKTGEIFGEGEMAARNRILELLLRQCLYSWSMEYSGGW